MEKSADPRRLRRMIIDLLEADLDSDGYDLIDVRVFQGGGRHQIRLYVDTEEGVTLEGCAKASRTVSMLLEEADLIPGPYVIEVSSPGIRRPLRTEAHFAAAVGSEVELKLNPGHQPARLRGRLQEVVDGRLILDVPGPQGAQQEAAEGETEKATVDLDQVHEANLEPDLDVQALINADRRARKDAKRTERRKKAGAKKARGRGRNKPGKGSSAADQGGGKTE